ncbi:MAG: hypothetical protein P4M08_06485 [Oligoflexia bacterium]|nr:hypothetical protein [Oligoflexia bacterium]
MKQLSVLCLSLICLCSGAMAFAESSSSGSTQGSPKSALAWVDPATESSSLGQNSAVMESDHNDYLNLDRFYVSYFGTYHGSDLSQIGKPYQADQNGNKSRNPMDFDSELTTAYMVTPDIGVGPYMQFHITPVMGQGVGVDYLGVKTFDKKTIAVDHFTMYSNLILEAPTNTYDINRGVFGAVKTTPFVRYDFPRSRFSVGSWSELKDYAGAGSGKMYKVYVDPYVNYQLTSGISLNLSYEMEADHFHGTSGLSLYESDFQPGVLFNVTKKILVNPYLQFFTNNRLTADTTAVGAVITARVL